MRAWDIVWEVAEATENNTTNLQTIVQLFDHLDAKKNNHASNTYLRSYKYALMEHSFDFVVFCSCDEPLILSVSQENLKLLNMVVTKIGSTPTGRYTIISTHSVNTPTHTHIPAPIQREMI